MLKINNNRVVWFGKDVAQIQTGEVYIPGHGWNKRVSFFFEVENTTYSFSVGHSRQSDAKQWMREKVRELGSPFVVFNRYCKEYADFVDGNANAYITRTAATLFV